jgi:acetylornithine deacetylase
VPRIDNGRIYGRGACDAKGVLASMIFAIKTLIHNGYRDVALLVVVGEEIDGIGAITAAKHLKNKGIKFIINAIIGKKFRRYI